MRRRRAVRVVTSHDSLVRLLITRARTGRGSPADAMICGWRRAGVYSFCRDKTAGGWEGAPARKRRGPQFAQNHVSDQTYPPFEMYGLRKVRARTGYGLEMLAGGGRAISSAKEAVAGRQRKEMGEQEVEGGG